MNEIKEYGIPEEDQCCTNCKYMIEECTEETSRPCKNSGEAYYKKREGIIYEENYFVPEDLYLKMEYGCEACKHYDHGEHTSECHGCAYAYDDMWERAT